VSERPSFLLIVTDQQRADHLGCYGNKVVRTPQLDAIGAAGWRFDRCYVACPICMPNRATLMTGRMPSVHRVRHNGIPLSLRATTAVDLLRAAGYGTALVGKAHLQNMWDRPPLRPAAPAAPSRAAPPPALAEATMADAGDGPYDQELAARWRADPAHDLRLPYYGFERVFLCIDHGDQVEGHYARWLRERCPGAETLQGPANARAGRTAVAPQAWATAVPEELYPTAFVAEKTIECLEAFARDPARPFFLQCSFPDPHHPFTPPGKYWDLYAPGEIPLPPSFWPADPAMTPHVARLHRERDEGRAMKDTPAPFACTAEEARWATALTYGMITMIDDAVGRVLARLRALGLASRTVVMFTSDHGDFMGDHQLLLKGPIHYQGLIRVPLLWADPAAPRPRGVSDGLASTLDIPATILDRAGLAPFNGLQGRSLLPAVGGTDGPAREAVLIEEEGQRVYLGFDRPVRCRTLVTRQHRLTIYDGVAWGELYDLAADPHELVNRWADPGARDLRHALTELLLRTAVSYTDTSPFPMGLA
jgi:arylsulfatase A-like enzyme